MKQSFVPIIVACILIVVYPQGALSAERLCLKVFGNEKLKYTKDCTIQSSVRFMPNLPLLGGVYCFNNGTGICKAFAGQFEFYFNVFKDRVIGPVPDSEYVSGGMHTRVPASYSIDGNVVYADHSINWANQYVAHGRIKRRMLSINDFNWCEFAVNNFWPYKSAVKDYKSGGKYNIYFFNKQSCIYNTETKQFQHFNTRFLGNSSLRIDLDNNPLIFAMEDYLAGEVRLVKNKRQHWYEVPYQTVEYNKEGIRYFVEMSADQKLPCLINGTRAPLLTNRAYGSDLCLDDSYTTRPNDKTKNSGLVQNFCGVDEVETADYPIVHLHHRRGKVIEVDLHNLPKHPVESEQFYGVEYESDAQWETWAYHNYSFTATTTIPIGNSVDKVRVLSLYNDFSRPSNKYDENYPMPMMADFTAEWRNDRWFVKEQRSRAAQNITNLNYVDDIAYLYRCDTVLILFGPLYTELPANEFSYNTKNYFGSISALGAYEMINAAFADPANGSDALYFYHRLNYVALHRYRCGSTGKQGQDRSSGDQLVTAVKDGPYKPRWGPGQHGIFLTDPMYEMDHAIREETLFKMTNLIKGELAQPDAPDPARYKPLYDKAATALEEGASNLWLWIVVVVGALICVTLCMICVLSIRRRRRRKKGLATDSKGSTLSARHTVRSAKLVQSNVTDAPSIRSNLLRSVTPPQTRTVTLPRSTHRSTASSPPPIRSHPEAHSNKGKSVSLSRGSHGSFKGHRSARTAATKVSVAPLFSQGSSRKQ